MAQNQHHALVFGATGLLGWAVVDQLLAGASPAPTKTKSPSPNAPPPSFASVTALSNRPIPASSSLWPAPGHGTPELHHVSGINLQSDDLELQLRTKVDTIHLVTHAFYFVFSPFDSDHRRECELNCDMMRRVAAALNALAPRLKSFVYSGGTRGYGIYVPNGTFTAPLEESMADTLPADYAQTVAYPWFRQILTDASRGRDWSWSEVCPDAVVGFSPIGSNYSLALHWAQYLSLYAHNHGVAARETSAGSRVEVPFPGNEQAYDAQFTPVSSQILGKIAVHASLNPEKCGGKVINMLDSAQPTTFRQLWPSIAAWFGLVGVGPSGDNTLKPPGEYIEEYRHVFEEKDRPRALSAGVGIGNKQLDGVGWWLTFDRQLSATRLRDVGFEEERLPIEGWLEAFEKLRASGIIF